MDTRPTNATSHEAPPDLANADDARRAGVPRLVWLVLLAAVTATVWLALRPANEGPLPGITREPPLSVTGIELVDHADDPAGSPAGLAAAPGAVNLVYFGYLSCPDVCPTTLSDIRFGLRNLPSDQLERVRVTFVTVDPERDTPDDLRGYLEFFFDDSPIDIAAMLAPDEPTLEDAADQLGVVWQVQEHELGERNYDVVHSAITYVVDDTGTVVRELPFGTTPQEYQRIVDHVLG